MSGPDLPDSETWQAIYEHAPALVRWLVGILSFGVITILSMLYKWHRQDLQRIEKRMDHIDSRIDELLLRSDRHRHDD